MCLASHGPVSTCKQVAVRTANVDAGWVPDSRPSAMLLSFLSSDVRLAVRAMKDYTKALGVDWVEPESRVGFYAD